MKAPRSLPMAAADPRCRSLPMAAADRCRWPLPIVQLLLVGHPGVGTEGSSTEPTIAAAQATVYTPPPRIMAKAFSEVNEDKLDAEWARFFSILPELDEQLGVPSRPTS